MRGVGAWGNCIHAKGTGSVKTLASCLAYAQRKVRRLKKVTKGKVMGKVVKEPL